jgi:hypothetical protein
MFVTAGLTASECLQTKSLTSYQPQGGALGKSANTLIGLQADGLIHKFLRW